MIFMQNFHIFPPEKTYIHHSFATARQMINLKGKQTSIRVTPWYRPTSGLMQILHFDWLRYYRSISNSRRVAKFSGFVNLFISFYSQINIFFLC